MDTGIDRLAAYVRREAPAAGYELDVRGEQARLARDADLPTSTLARLLAGERMPMPAALWPLAQAVSKRDGIAAPRDAVIRRYNEMLVEGGIIPAESVAQGPRPDVSSQPITAEVLADQWGVTDAKGRELVRDMLNRLRLLAQQPPDDQSGRGRAEAHG